MARNSAMQLLRVGVIGFIAWTTVAATVGATEQQAPNIIIYMADDLGYGSIQPFGADPGLVQTPHLQALADSGIALREAYASASVCSPTRYGLLTGRYSWRSSLKYGTVNPFGALIIEDDTQTIGGWLQQRGYRTAHIGKWHLGYSRVERYRSLIGHLTPGPNDVGFDYHFGVPNNLDDRQKVYVENDTIFGLRSHRIQSYGRSFYGSPYVGYDAPQRDVLKVMDETTQRAIEWIEQGERNQPFFLYFASVAVHHPIRPSPAVAGTSGAGPYGDFIHDIDQSLGKLIATLRRLDMMDNTIVLFTSDNGGDIPTQKWQPENAALEAGLVMNGPLRGDKHEIWEGGLKVPTIVSWPAVLPQGQSSDALVTTVDVFATIAELVSGAVPAVNEAAPDSISFAPVLRDPARPSVRTTAVFRDVHGRKALRHGDWKYVDGHNARKPNRRLPGGLFDLQNDPLEANDVAGSYPERVSNAQALLQKIMTNEHSRELCSHD